MGYVVFQSRQGNQELGHDFLFDQDDNDETLSAFLLWDTVILTRNITESEYRTLSQHPISGVKVRRKAETPDTVEPGYEADFEFTVTKRSHQILPDWMSDRRGYRLSSTKVVLQAVSEEAESILTALPGFAPPMQFGERN